MGLGCSHVSWRLKRGLWLTMTGQPYRDIKKLEEGNGVGSMKEGGCVGEVLAQPRADRLVWKSIHLGG